MFTKQDLKKDLKQMGILPTDTLKVHASMRAIGEIEGGADTLIDALKETVPEGLLVIPTHTWHEIPRESQVYDVRKQVPCIGVLSEVAAFRLDGVRSLHPTHSVAAFGRDAEAFVSGEENATSPCFPEGITSKLLSRHAKVLLIGVGQEKDTVLHGLEEILDTPDRLTDDFKEIIMIDRDGNAHKTSLRRHRRPISMYFPKFEEPFSELHAYEVYRLGNARAELCDVDKMFEILKRIVSRTDMELCADHEPIPREYWEP